MLKTIQDISPEAMELLSEYDWPGNVRELENAIEHAFVRCRGEEIVIQHLPKQIKDAGKPESGQLIQSLKIPLQNTEREVLLKVLEEVGQNRKKAAQKLGVSKATLWRKMKKHHIL